MNATEQKEIVDEFVKESDAVRLMKLKEAVYHPADRSWKHPIIFVMLVGGPALIIWSLSSSLPRLNATGIFGLMIMFTAILGVLEIRIRQIHDRIDKLLELEFGNSDKQRTVASDESA